MADVILINPVYKSLPINPSIYKQMVFKEPIGLLYLGTYLDKAGYGVKIIDACPYHVLGDNSYYTILKNEMKDALCVGFSIMTEQIENALKISDFIKKIDPKIYTIWGGIHPTLFPTETCKDQLVDFVISGEGENTLLELIDHFSKGNEKYSNIDGLVYKEEGGRVKMNKPRKLLEINDLPPPKWDLLEVNRYITKPDGKRSLQVHSSRGCPHRCSFCVNRILTFRKWRAKSPEKVLDEMEYIIKEYKLDGIRFSDENYPVNMKRADRIAEGIIDRGFNISWFMNVRADYFRSGLISGDRLKKWVKSGLDTVSIGAESGSDRILKLIRKDITAQQLIRSAFISNKYGLKAEYSFMIGLPGETKEDMRKTLEVIQKIKEINPRFRLIGPQIFRPYPGGDLYDACKEAGFEEPKSLRGWIDLDSLHSTGYASLKMLPWIKDKDYVYFLSKNMIYLLYDWDELSNEQDYTGIPPSKRRAVFGVVQKIRWKTKFLSFPYEDIIYQKFIKFIKSHP